MTVQCLCYMYEQVARTEPLSGAPGAVAGLLCAEKRSLVGVGCCSCSFDYRSSYDFKRADRGTGS